MGFLYEEHLALGCAYSPNTFEISFYSKLLADLSSDSTYIIILGGDYNACLDPALDQNPSKAGRLLKMAEATKELCCDLNLFDT